MQKEIDRIASVGIAPGEQLNAFFGARITSTPLKAGCKLIDLLRRPELSYADLAPFDAERPELPAVIREQVEIRIKYAGYIERQERDASSTAGFRAVRCRLIWTITRWTRCVWRRGRS